MCYWENGTVKSLIKTLENNAFRYNYSMMQIEKIEIWDNFGVTQAYTLKYSKWCIWFFVIVFNATINNISAISWRPVLVVEEAGVPGENYRP